MLKNDAPEIPEIELPKWPAFVVQGDPISADLAEKVILETTRFTEWDNREILEILGWEDLDYEALRAQQKALFGTLGQNMQCLVNERVSTSYIDGVHGWCDWDGSVGCSSYNIGKWPTVEEVEAEWAMIADRFPFLRLKCQLLAEEWCSDEEPRVAAEFHVGNGKVKVIHPDNFSHLIRPLEDFAAPPLWSWEEMEKSQRVDPDRFREILDRYLQGK